MSAAPTSDAAPDATSDDEPGAALVLLTSACGRVSASQPTGFGTDVYWRLEYYFHGKRMQTSGGRTKAAAVKAMTKVVTKLDSNAAARSTTKIGEVLDLYEVHLKNSSSRLHALHAPAALRRALGHLDRVACCDLQRVQLIESCDAATSPSTATHRKSYISAFVKWGHRKEYFTRDQTLFLAGYEWSPKATQVLAPTRKRSGRRAGETERYVALDEVPTHDAIRDLGDAFADVLPSYGKLLIELAHTSGLRGGEIYALDARSLDLDKHYCAVDHQILSISGVDRRALPKGGKTRTTNFSDVTTTGFNLRDALELRLEEIEHEHSAGRNPRRLVFPAPFGGWWWATSFTNDFYARAATAAGFDRLEWIDDDGKPRKQWVHTMHSLRHRFARDRIDLAGYSVAELQLVGGWDSAQVVWERYYGLSTDLLETATKKLLG